MRLWKYLGLALIALAACQHQSPDEKLLKSVDSAASWIPSLQLVAEKWLANEVPSSFVKNAAEAADKTLKKAMQSVEKADDASVELRKALSRDLDQGSRFAAALKAAQQNDDPRSIAKSVHSLKAVQDDLEQLKKKYGGGSQ